jgi:hypothetical protein
MENAFTTAKIKGLQDGRQFLQRIGRWGIAPLMLSVQMIHTPPTPTLGLRQNRLYVSIGYLCLPGALLLTLATFTAALVVGLGVAIGTPLYAEYQGMKASLAAQRIRDAHRLIMAMQMPFILARTPPTGSGRSSALPYCYPGTFGPDPITTATAMQFSVLLPIRLKPGRYN